MRVAQGVVSTSRSLAAPVGGWNARDALGAMPIEDAPIMTNWWPATSSVWMRYGHSEHVTGISGQVETLMVYNGPTTSKMFGIASGSIYDVTSAGAVGAAVVTGLTNSRFQYINVATASGAFLMSVNGADKLQGYDGSAWYEDGDGSHDITGVDTADCSQINLFKNRVWLIEDDSLDAWYLGTGAIAGAATKFPLGGIANLGGYLVAMATWTIDAGYGVDDLAAFITSEGEVIVYRGTDPTSANTWALVGVWKIGNPIGKRCYLKFAGDMLIVCQDGVVPMSAALQSSRLNPKVSLTDKISFAMSQAVSQYGENFGWQLLYFPKENQLYLNVPVQEGDNQQQYVMNTITKNWCNFTGWEANCWEILNEAPYFGGNGAVYKAWDGLSDNDTDIEGFLVHAFSDFNDPAHQKRFTMMRPVLFSNGSPNLLGEVNVDFDLADTTSPLSFSSTSYAVWDTGVWDTALWGSDLAPQQNWQSVTGIGYYGAPVLKVAAQGIQVQYVNTTVVFERQKGTNL